LATPQDLLKLLDVALEEVVVVTAPGKGVSIRQMVVTGTVDPAKLLAGGRLAGILPGRLEHRLVGADGRPQPTIEVSFSDTGPGIPAEILNRLSTPFFTTKRKGTGLGLSVARHWIGRHGGRLRIESIEGEGTRVHADLPLIPKDPDASESPEAP
jgi:signal transduction histidine kinase